MATGVTYVNQYRPTSDEETDTNAGLSVRGVRDLADGINNTLLTQFGPAVAQMWPTTGLLSPDSAVTDETVIGMYAGRSIPDGLDVWRWGFGASRTTGAGNIVITLYASNALYRGKAVFDSTHLPPLAASASLTVNSNTHAFYVLTDANRIPMQARPLTNTEHIEYLLVTATNDSGSQATITSMTMSPQRAT